MPDLDERPRRFASARAKSTPLAYVLDIFLGELGIHRFYLGEQGTGLAMLLITVLTRGIGLIVTLPWAIVDLFLIPRMLERATAPTSSRSSRR